MESVIPLLGLLLAGTLVYAKLTACVIVYDFQKGLLYRKGRFVKLLNAGKYRFPRNSSAIQVIDMRKTLITLPGQEILTKDNLSIKVSLSGAYEISDPVKAKHLSQNYLSEFYNQAQIALRDIAGSYAIDEFLAKKDEIDTRLMSVLGEKGKNLGLTVAEMSVKDIMLPANLKKAFSGIVEAQKEAQKQLEKARGEQAVLRNLANSSNLYESNPMLLQARIIQSLSSGGNTIVYGADDRAVSSKKSA